MAIQVPPRGKFGSWVRAGRRGVAGRQLGPAALEAGVRPCQRAFVASVGPSEHRLVRAGIVGSSRRLSVLPGGHPLPASHLSVPPIPVPPLAELLRQLLRPPELLLRPSSLSSVLARRGVRWDLRLLENHAYPALEPPLFPPSKPENLASL